MSESRHSSIKFSLEESVLFKSGQEVDELISISLDPNISIVEEEGFVMLRGSLDLTGEYKCLDSDGEVEEDTSVKGRYVHQVEVRDEGECEFFHQFPVDITIPKDRVHHSNEVFVEVESFDYVMPENSRLNIQAEVHVFGLQGEEQDEQHTDVPFPMMDERDDEMDAEEESTVEVELEEYEQENQPELVESVEDEEAEEDLYAPFTAEARNSGDNEQRPPRHDHHNPFPFPFPMIPEMDMDEVADRLKGFFQKHSLESPSTSSGESSSSSSTVEESPVHESSSHESAMMEESSEVKPKKKKKDKYHSMSFADFFARKEEDTPAKLTVRLVQHGDSLERLADKYGVSVQQILRANQLDASHEVSEGQVLYIPGKTAYRK
ncbi:spore coat assembly protein SpoVID [Bacillus freudenreichii]|nr:spore coat assembly protein SpoVID [Bacillus freudenreichii]